MPEVALVVRARVCSECRSLGSTAHVECILRRRVRFEGEYASCDGCGRRMTACDSNAFRAAMCFSLSMFVVILCVLVWE